MSSFVLDVDKSMEERGLMDVDEGKDWICEVMLRFKEKILLVRYV